ncbi:MAG: hypothetical protein MJ229_04315 [bacterium]|nr:hypothetical protein [bacterium]
MTEISELTQKIAQQTAIKKTADTTATQAQDDHTSILGDLGSAKQEADSVEISFNQANDAAKTADDNLSSALSTLSRAEDGVKNAQETLESAKESGNEELIQKMQTNFDRATQAYEKASQEAEKAKEEQGVTQQAKADAETKLEASKNNVAKLTQDETKASDNAKTTKTTADEEGNKLNQLTEQKEQLEAEEAAKAASDKDFDTAMNKAAENIKNADGAFDGKKDGASTHLEQSIALANQPEEDRKNIQAKLTKEFDSTDHNFDKEAGRSATHGYAVEDRDLANLNEVTGMLDGSSAENVAKMYQCAVPLNGDDVFKMEADTVAGLLEESKTGFSDENKAKILNSIDNGMQGETPVTHTKYDRQVVDVFTDNYTTEVSDADIEKQINTLKDKVSGSNPEPLTEKEFRAITYLYDIDAGGEKIGITNWDGSLGVQEGQQFNKRELEAMAKIDTTPVQGEGEGAPVDAVAVKNIYASRQDQMTGSSHVLKDIPEDSIILENSTKCRTRKDNAIAASSKGYDGKFINQAPIKSENSSQTVKYSGYFLHNQPEDKLSDFEKSLVQSMRDEASSNADGKCKTYYMIVTHSRENIGNGFKDRGIEYGGSYDQCLIAFTVSDDGKTWTKTTPEIYDDYMKKIKK